MRSSLEYTHMDGKWVLFLHFLFVWPETFTYAAVLVRHFQFQVTNIQLKLVWTKWECLILLAGKSRSRFWVQRDQDVDQVSKAHLLHPCLHSGSAPSSSCKSSPLEGADYLGSARLTWCLSSCTPQEGCPLPTRPTSAPLKWLWVVLLKVDSLPPDTSLYWEESGMTVQLHSDANPCRVTVWVMDHQTTRHGMGVSQPKGAEQTEGLLTC